MCAGVASRPTRQDASRPGRARFSVSSSAPPGRCAPCRDGAPQATGLRGPIPTRPDDPDERLAITQNGGSRFKQLSPVCLLSNDDGTVNAASRRERWPRNFSHSRACQEERPSDTPCVPVARQSAAPASGLRRSPPVADRRAKTRPPNAKTRPLRRVSACGAEREGFEPSTSLTTRNGFRVRRRSGLEASTHTVSRVPAPGARHNMRQFSERDRTQDGSRVRAPSRRRGLFREPLVRSA